MVTREIWEEKRRLENGALGKTDEELSIEWFFTGSFGFTVPVFTFNLQKHCFPWGDKTKQYLLSDCIV